tara:strand:- start:1242 stop:1985 length:744 start_codon:yes stop_codon:yes gene_type:complete
MNIITEIGLNHIGNYELAIEYINSIADCDVHGITFQVREPEFYLRSDKKHLQLSEQEYKNLFMHVKSKGKLFGIAIADCNKIDFFESIDIDFYKVIRNDITNKELISKLMSTGKDIIISTGLSSDEDIQNFINEFGTKNVTLNHTQLSYSESDCNLRAINGMRQKYNVPVSFGSHCENKNVLFMSLCYNPSHILFYVKMDDMIYPDDKHAVSIEKINNVVSNIHKLSSALGIEDKEKLGNKIPEMNI